ncbi:EF-hand domain-containing protein [Prosthecomicrobium sp. N25]|uniref:EF-hand domain-containing protein n=1 Tax=Prosthecomicrobium sp. N25 TaxID=3129254 RepID=UPI003077D8E0
MKTWTMVVLGAGALAVVAGGVAVAEGRHMMGHGWGPEGGGPGYGHGEMMGRMFNRLDANKDGTVTTEEALAMPDARFADIDKNKDGFVDRSEIDAMIKQRREAMIDRWIKRFDVDGDGKISKEEAEKPFRKRFALFDRNDDGKVTEEEARDAMPMWGFGEGRGREGWHGRMGHGGMGPWHGPDRM